MSWKVLNGYEVKITLYEGQVDDAIIVGKTMEIREAQCPHCNKFSSQITSYGSFNYDFCPRCGRKVEAQ